MSIGVGPDIYEAFDLPAANSRRVPCACGLDIVAIDDDAGRAIAVRTHQQTRQHTIYVQAMTQRGLYEPLPAAIRNAAALEPRHR